MRSAFEKVKAIVLLNALEPLMYIVNRFPLRTKARWYHVFDTMVPAVPCTTVVPMTNPGVFEAVTLCAIRISLVPRTPVEKMGMLV